MDDDGVIQSEIRDVPIENPDYDPDLVYEPRSERPEWNVVGMLGQIFTNVENHSLCNLYQHDHLQNLQQQRLFLH